MCGIFGVIMRGQIDRLPLAGLLRRSQRRGADASGLLYWSDDAYSIRSGHARLDSLYRSLPDTPERFLMGHSRLATNGVLDNQPVYQGDVCVIHNGIVTNDGEIWRSLDEEPTSQIDTAVIAAFFADGLRKGTSRQEIVDQFLGACEGVVAAAVALPTIGKLLLFSNNGSLYLGQRADSQYFASEQFTLRQVGCTDIVQVRSLIEVEIPQSLAPVRVFHRGLHNASLLPTLGSSAHEEKLLEFPTFEHRRCTACVLPETMPFIEFDDEGVCNYCRNYHKRNMPRPLEELHALVEPYRRARGQDCIVPFSGGRDSSYGLHLVVNELGMRPIAFTYDWGMVTDLGRRNISRMCATLGVENIVVADDIPLKRRNIELNLRAWLESPHLGLLSLLTAGDKHFYRHVETIKNETQIPLNLWGVNPLEVTHFKAGFLGVPPDFDERRVYRSGLHKQLDYHQRRFRAMSSNRRYFNRSIWDTLSGEYYRSIHAKGDYFHLFDYWRWDEEQIDKTLDSYGWERAPDTHTTWRIGDGTAAFYNYVYYSSVGFTEHDTFRSNQIREGDLDRDTALQLVSEENRPRYPNIRWYLDAVGVDYEYAISAVNRFGRLHRELS